MKMRVGLAALVGVVMTTVGIKAVGCHPAAFLQFIPLLLVFGCAAGALAIASRRTRDSLALLMAARNGALAGGVVGTLIGAAAVVCFFKDTSKLGSGVASAIISTFYPFAAQALLLLPLEAALLARDSTATELPRARLGALATGLIIAVTAAFSTGVVAALAGVEGLPRDILPFRPVFLAMLLAGPAALLVAAPPHHVGPSFGKLLSESFLASSGLVLLALIVHVLENLASPEGVFNKIAGGALLIPVGILCAILSAALFPSEAGDAKEARNERGSFAPYAAYFAGMPFILTVGILGSVVDNRDNQLSWKKTEPAATDVTIPFPSAVDMSAQVYRPDGAGPFPVLIFLHGRAPKESERRAMREGISEGHAHYWTQHGFAVVAPIRPGYGANGGADQESNSGPSNQFCTQKYDYRSTSDVGAEAAVSTLAWVAKQPWADPKSVIIEGQSVGGVAAINACAKHLPGVIGCVNFSGGAGGNAATSPDHSCQPQALSELYLQMEASSAPPSIWLYAPNDHYWGAEMPRAWFKAYEDGGGHGQFIETEPISTGEGHDLLRVGGKLWSVPLDGFIKSLGL